MTDRHIRCTTISVLLYLYRRGEVGSEARKIEKKKRGGGCGCMTGRQAKIHDDKSVMVRAIIINDYTRDYDYYDYVYFLCARIRPRRPRVIMKCKHTLIRRRRSL